MTGPAFAAKWRVSTLTERSASQSHFNDLCQLVGSKTPTDDDPTGQRFTFEKGATKEAGGQGFADVWKRGHFAWEYKGKRKNLVDAYRQLQQYRDDLENPPLLVVCDLDRFEVHTNFTGTARRTYAFDLGDLEANLPTDACPLPPLDVLRAVFFTPNRLRPTETTEYVTEKAAAEFAKLAKSLHDRGHDPEAAAHFLMRLLFCLFSEDIGLLPAGLFTRLVERTRFAPAVFGTQTSQLFAAMATGGWFGEHQIDHFDGGLFADSATLELTASDVEVLHGAARLEWASVEPAIFGTLFERSLDPSKRAQLGAHYTSRDDILLIVEPVLMEPLRRHWQEVHDAATDLIARRDAATTAAQRSARETDLRNLLMAFQDELASIRVLDPACGSGNFLYVALKRLLDLEKEVITFFGKAGLTLSVPTVGPEQLHGIEVNPYAHELAQIVVWIGYIQWLRDNGFGTPSSPILKPLTSIVQMDAILGTDADGEPFEPAWPRAYAIIGNPPFLGDKKMRAELGDEYVEPLRRLYGGRVPGGADLVTYWFERARSLIADGRASRAGLLATNSIRGGSNRRVIERIKQSGDIFLAWSDRPWVLDGADVRVSIVGFDSGSLTTRYLDGAVVATIPAGLTSAVDLSTARPLCENQSLASIGDQKTGPFDIPRPVTAAMLAAPVNPNGRPNSDVVRPWVNGMDVVRRPRGMSIVDFGVATSEGDASLYEAPFEYVRKIVKPSRDRNSNPTLRRFWWLHERPRPELRQWIAPLSRFIATPTVSRHRVFVWLRAPTIADKQLVVFARDDDYFIGVLHSRVHELWTLQMCTWLGVGNDPRYTPTTTFETFPFPWPPGTEPAEDPRVAAIANAARELHVKREAWLNPPDALELELRKRTLTALYNSRPAWLANIHNRLDRAVLEAYGWPHDLTDNDLLERLLALNLSRPAAS